MSKPRTKLETLLGQFTPEEVETGVIKPGRHPKRLVTPSSPKAIRTTLERELIARSVGDALALARREREMSLAEVGERLDVSRGRVAQLEKPEANLEVATLVRVADALDYDVVVTLRPRGQKRELIVAELRGIRSRATAG